MGLLDWCYSSCSAWSKLSVEDLENWCPCREGQLWMDMPHGDLHSLEESIIKNMY